jgi:hypothetical protein
MRDGGGCYRGGLGTFVEDPGAADDENAHENQPWKARPFPVPPETGGKWHRSKPFRIDRK